MQSVVICFGQGSVDSAICSAIAGNSLTGNMHRDSISYELADSGVSTGSLLIISALAFSFDGMYWMSYWYPASTNTQRYIRAAAIDGMPVFGTNIFANGR